jgi:GTP-binding protein
MPTTAQPPIIQNASFTTSALKLSEAPPAGIMPEIAMVGRSNVGKSSLINALTSRKNLARTSNTPGKTRRINYYQIDYLLPTIVPAHEPCLPESVPSPPTGERVRVRGQANESPTPQSIYLVDLPGYGYAKVSKTEQQAWQKHLETYLLKRKGLLGVIQIVDIRHDPQPNDLAMAKWLTHHKMPFGLVLNKADKIGKQQWQKQHAAFCKAFNVPRDNAWVISSETQHGCAPLWQFLLGAIHPE